MTRTRYREERTLVRRVCRLPGESRQEFKSKVLHLRRLFEQFNVDASEICQWLMGFRPGAKRASDATKPLWDFFLEPETVFPDTEEDQLDRYRCMVFDVVAGFDGGDALSQLSLRDPLVESVRAVAQLPITPTAEQLFIRLKRYIPSHRQILLKAAAEWVVARYQRGVDNWKARHKEWKEEKDEWESAHPQLTESVRKSFTDIFRDLEISRKNPRLCGWERLKSSKDDCEYAGKGIRLGNSWKNHAMLCVKYREFFAKYGKNNKSSKAFKKYFVENAEKYIELRNRMPGRSKKEAMDAFLRENERAGWFRAAWDAYLKALGITEETAVKEGNRLPHCVRFNEKKDCEFNVHTEDCRKYGERLLERPDLQELESLYREWRKDYLAGPRKPSFRYPSKRELPMPKIFGKGFFDPDFENSEVDLRFEDMPPGTYVNYGFVPWPKKYRPQPDEAQISSVHVNFVGTRARIGFRFKVEHGPSSFTITQDEIDDLRSRKYPREKQDKKFLSEARERLHELFTGDWDRELRVLAVDLGTGGGGFAVFEGRRCIQAGALKIVKIDELYDARPKKDDDPKQYKFAKTKGLGHDHVGLHLKRYGKSAGEIAAKRQELKMPHDRLGDYDMRSLSLHVRWMIRDWVRLNSAQIVAIAEENNVNLIVFESMRGFRLPGYEEIDERKKRELAFFAHGRTRRKVAEKAVERGMRVVTVPYFKSSQHCAECGKEQDDKGRLRRNKSERKFECEKCHHKADSDANAARVLGRVFWGEIDLPEKPVKSS